MTHLGLIAVSYAAALLITAIFSIAAAKRPATGRRRLAGIDPRAAQ